MKFRKVAVAMVCAAVSFIASAITLGPFTSGTVYVSQANGSDSNNGSSWENAKKTIQAGINAAQAGYTVLVGEGDYGKDVDDFTDRVYNTSYTIPTVAYLDKKIKVVSAAGKDKTFITGKWADTPTGVGAGAKRCVFLAAAGAVVDGFTIRNGSVVKDNNTNTGVGDNGGANDFVCGGAGVAASVGDTYKPEGQVCQGYTVPTTAAYVINCTIEDCRGFRGAALTRAVPLNCLFRGNVASSTSPSGHCTYRCYCAYNCIFVDNGNGSGQVQSPSSDHCSLNCTYINNKADSFFGPSSTENARAYNSAFISNTTEAAGTETTLLVTNCVTTFSTGRRATGPGCLGGVNFRQVVSTVSDDFRPISGSALIGAGSKERLSWAAAWVPEEYRYKDYYGNARSFGEGDTVDVGAVQSPSGGVNMVCGFIDLDAGVAVSVGGKSYRARQAGPAWLGLAAHPGEQVRVSCAVPTGKALFGYAINAGSWSIFQYPDRKGDEGFYLNPPLKSTCTNLSIVPSVTSSVKWADPTLPDYSGADGSYEHPYETLQQAVDAVAAKGVVYAKPGVYAEGATIPPIDLMNDGQDTNSTPSRVCIGKDVRMVSTEGAKRTIIKGAQDDSASGAYSGCGTNAVRCVLVDQSKEIAIQGFTITGGGTDGDLANRGRWDKDGGGNPRFNSSDNIQRGNFGGGGVRASKYNYTWEKCVVTDSIISNNVAYWGSAMYGGTAQRCVITGNRCVTNDPGATHAPYGHLYGVTLRGSLVYGNGARGSNASIPSQSRIRFSTVYGDTTEYCMVYDSSMTGETSKKPGAVCVAPATGDFRIHSGSDAIAGGRVSNDSDFVKYSTSDVYGNPILFNPADPGQFAMGAVQEVALVLDCAGESGTGAEVDKTAISPGETATITATGKRRVVGYRINGTLVEDTARSYTFVAPAYDYSLYSSNWFYSVKAVYETNVNWYVNPAKDDANDGYTPETAKKTLAGVMSDVWCGDTVHAAPGTYDSGSMKRNAAFNGGAASNVQNSARVVIPEGVALVADGDATDTVIVGYKEPGSPSYTWVTSWGLGPNAMRCVEMCYGATLKGFTLKDGATDWSTSQSSGWIAENCYGGGVMCKDNACVIENCVITNCHSRYAGGAVRGTLVGTKILCCAGSSAHGGATLGKYYSCYFNGCFDQVVGQPAAMENCTIGPDNLIWGRDSVGILIANAGSTPLKNCVILQALSGSTTNTYTFQNTAWVPTAGVEASGTSSGFTRPTAAELKIGADGRPQTESVAIDTGDNSLMTHSYATVDADGGQRIYDGVVDKGAFEYDWRGAFAKDLHRRLVAVDKADPNVVETADGSVLVRDGELAVTCIGDQMVFPVTVVGDGELNVYGESPETPLYTVRSEAGRQDLTFKNSLGKTYRFVLTPGDNAENTDGALLGKAFYGMGTLIRVM